MTGLRALVRVAGWRHPLRRARAWLDCIPRPPAHTLTDRWGRRWGLWCDGRWINPGTLPAVTRLDVTTALGTQPATQLPLRLVDTGSSAGGIPAVYAQACTCDGEGPWVEPDCPVHGELAR